MDTLLDLLAEIERLGSREAVRWSNGLRTWIWTYTTLHQHIASFANWLDDQRIVKGDRILLWGENRPEWLAAFWGAVARGVELVPVDFRFSADLVKRIEQESGPKLLVHGYDVDTRALSLRRISYEEVSALPSAATLSTVSLTGNDIVEIVYTSGTTGEPKGVVHRHRNICANLNPFRQEIDKYKKWAMPFQPVRLLNLLPLSHMFGQSQGLFIPLLLGGAVVFTDEIRPAAIMHIARSDRVSVIVSVPRILETLKSEIEQRFEIPPPPMAKGWPGVARRWWTYRRIHSQFGWKFWAFVVGGARVDPELEEFWFKLGYIVIQGYGLTEASPVVAVNHPFNARRGSLGKVVPGQDVKIAADGEIMVRGESVTGKEGEWLHTGDLGEIDAEGRLYYRGRKKELIVTPEGLNVHPEDVEAVLTALEGVRDAAVVAVDDQVHAALILSDPSVDPGSVVSRANEKLEAHQRIRGWTVWKEPDFPRTASTFKVKRHEVARRIASGKSPKAPSQPKSALDELLARKSSDRLSEEVGLSSLERVELLSELENRSGIEIDEETFAHIKTVGELQSLARAPRRPGPPGAPHSLSGWPRSFPARIFRFLAQRGLVLPLFHHYIPTTVTGLEHLENVVPPVLFAANHTSNLDTIAIVAALPADWRKLLAPAMSKDHFRAWFERHSPVAGIQYVLARSIFNTYPLPQEMSGVRNALRYTADLVEQGYCPLVYPEGQRTRDGKMHAFRPGIGMMAVKLEVPVVPVKLSGLFEVYSIHDSWPKRGPVRVAFGRALHFPPNTTLDSAAKAIENAVRSIED